MEIKTCSKDDIDELIAISNLSYRDHYTYLWYDNGEEYIKSNFSQHQLEEELADPNVIFYLLCLDKQTVGYIKLNIDQGIENHSPAAALELERIYFIKNATGKGSGKLVIDFVVELARKKNKKVIWLKSMDSSKAVDFYKRQGFFKSDEFLLDFPNMKPGFKKILVLQKSL